MVPTMLAQKSSQLHPYASFEACHAARMCLRTSRSYDGRRAST